MRNLRVPDLSRPFSELLTGTSAKEKIVRSDKYPFLPKMLVPTNQQLDNIPRECQKPSRTASLLLICHA